MISKEHKLEEPWFSERKKKKLWNNLLQPIKNVYKRIVSKQICKNVLLLTCSTKQLFSNWHCSVHPLQIESNLFSSQDHEPKYTTEVTQMETVVNMNMHLVFPSAVSSSMTACTHSSAEYSLISNRATPEQCIGITHDKKCIRVYIIKLSH